MHAQTRDRLVNFGKIGAAAVIALAAPILLLSLGDDRPEPSTTEVQPSVATQSATPAPPLPATTPAPMESQPSTPSSDPPEPSSATATEPRATANPQAPTGQWEALFSKVAGFERALFSFEGAETQEEFYEGLVEFATPEYADLLTAAYLGNKQAGVYRSQTVVTADDVSLADELLPGQMVRMVAEVNVEQYAEEGRYLENNISTHESVWVLQDDGNWLAIIPPIE